MPMEVEKRGGWSIGLGLLGYIFNILYSIDIGLGSGCWKHEPYAFNVQASK